MVTNGIWLASGLIFGILFIWFGGLTAVVTLPLARGEVRAREYNHQLWQPEFIRNMADAEHDGIARKNAKWVIVGSLLMVALGVSMIAIGALSIVNPVVIALIVSAFSLVMIPIAYGLIFLSWRKMQKVDE